MPSHQTAPQGSTAPAEQHHAALGREEGFLQAVLGHLGDGVVACDAEGRLTLMNGTAQRWHGQGHGRTGRRDWAERFSLTDLDGTPVAPDDVPLARILDGQRVHDVPLVLRPEGLPARTVLCSGERLVDEHGRVLGAVVSMRDVTAERAAEARAERRATALAATVEAQRAAVDLGADVPAMLDVVALSALRALPGASGASVLLRRDRAARWLPDVVGSLDGDAVTGRLADGSPWSADGDRTFVGAARAGRHASEIGVPVPVVGSLAGSALVQRRSQHSGDVPADRRVHQNVDLSVGVRSMLLVPLLVEGEAVGVVQVTHADRGAFDQHDEHALEVLVRSVAALLEHADARLLLEQHASRLAAAGALKDDLISLLGHDVQSPLASIVGYAELAVDELGTGHAAGPALAAVQRAAGRITRIVREVLTLVSLDGEGLHARPAPTLLAASVEAATELARDPGRTEVRGDLHLVAQVQVEHLDQVLLNLLTNADKYAGGATAVVLETERDDRGQAHAALVHVDDDGPGVAAALRPRLFERFSRAAGAERVSGTGLGLYLSRTLVEANGGSLWHEPREGGGSRFSIRLPLPPEV